VRYDHQVDVTRRTEAIPQIRENDMTGGAGGPSWRLKLAAQAGGSPGGC
jgi:hypothetical protein